MEGDKRNIKIIYAVNIRKNPNTNNENNCNLLVRNITLFLFKKENIDGYMPKLTISKISIH